MRITDAAFVKSVADGGALPTDGLPEVAFVGRSNVGKSTLLNRLTGQNALARTSRTPGRTRTFNFYLAERPRGGSFYLVDLPGLGYAKASKRERERWQRIIVRYLLEREPLRLVMHLIDSRHVLTTALDRELLQLLGGQRVPYLAVLTKADKLRQGEHDETVRRAKEALLEAGLEAPVLLTSAKSGQGIDEVRAWMGDLVR